MHKINFKRSIILLVAIIFGLSPTNAVFANSLSDSQLDMFAQNNILFYDPSEADCTDSKISGSQITWIGDSYSVGAKTIIEEKFKGVDLGTETDTANSYIQVGKFVASGSSSNPAGLTILKELASSKKLRKHLIFALGTNGGWTQSTVDEFVALLDTYNITATLVTSRTPKSDYAESNELLRQAAKSSSKITIAEWSDVYQESYFTGDSEKIHPVSNGGYQAWVDTIYKALPGTSSVASGGNNTNYAGDTVWSEAELAMIEENKAIYQEAVEEYDFPWQVMAVLHSMETGLRRYNPDNGQGVYQLYSYTGGGENSNRFVPASSISEEEFLRQTKIAAGIAVEMAGDLNDPDNVKKLFFKYNGTAQTYIDKALNMGFSQEEAENGEGSIYVMNRYDEQRDPSSSKMSTYWPGRYVADGVYDSDSTTMVFGAFVKYEAIAGSGQCDGGGGAKIAQTAIDISWDTHRVHAKDDPKPEYVVAMKEVGNYYAGCNDSGCAPIGASCDQFVSTAVRYSGVDPDFPTFGPGTQENYMQNHPEMYKQIDHNNDVDNLQPGDILVANDNGNHIYIYIGEIDGNPSQASASFNDRTGEHFAGVYFTDNYGADGGIRHYNVYRYIGD